MGLTIREYTKRDGRGRPSGASQKPVIFCVRGVTSPLLANVYLHYVFDLWIEAWRQKVATGDVIVVRYADDLVVGFENPNGSRAIPESISGTTS
jgi:hypothetical protein